MKGFAGLPIIILIVIVLGVFFLVGSYFRENKPQINRESNQQGQQQQSFNLPGVNNPFYNKDGLYLTHSWPSEGSFSAEETEILLFNESADKVEIKSFSIEYLVEGKTYPHKSGTWEKFPSKDNHERIEYINISAQHYQNQPLALARGEKGKLHWHINFGSQPLSGKQTVRVKLTLLKGNQTINIDEQFNRDSGTVVNKEDH